MNNIFTTEELHIILAVIILLILLLWLWIYVPARMAKKRGRSVIGWILLFWIISPLWGMIALAVLGDSKKKLRRDIMEELQNNK